MLANPYHDIRLRQPTHTKRDLGRDHWLEYLQQSPLPWSCRGGLTNTPNPHGHRVFEHDRTSCDPKKNADPRP